MKSQLSFFDGTELKGEFISPTGMNVIRQAMDEYAREYAKQFMLWQFKRIFPDKNASENGINHRIDQFEKDLCV